MNTAVEQGYKEDELMKVGCFMKKVLIADDALFMRNSLRMMLEKNGFEVVGVVDNGLDAVSLADKLSPDIVTLDITMPKLNGIEALRKIKRYHPEISVVMLTSLKGESILKECISIGATNFIIKPFKEKTLIEIVTKS